VAIIGHYAQMETPAELGRRLVREMRDDRARESDDAAFFVLRWGAESMSDEDLWTATLAALEEASEEGEYWQLGDGLVDESVRPRPKLERRWRESRAGHPKIAEVYRVMQDPRWNWGPDPSRWGELRPQ
jgi:hypothetical protein